jgi:tetratricopeptide (TPR) repeat protein
VPRRYLLLISTLASLLLPALPLRLPRRAFVLSPLVASPLVASPLLGLVAPLVASASPLPASVASLDNQAEALTSQGSVLAARPLYLKVTVLAPDFPFGHGGLANAQTALGDLPDALASYSRAISLCAAPGAGEAPDFSLLPAALAPGKPACGAADLATLHLNRGAVLLASGGERAALEDLEKAQRLRGRPDAVLLQNLGLAHDYLQE